MADGMKTTVKGGRVRGPNLSDPQLKAIGDLMVAAQKERWLKGVDAAGQPAAKLSVRYAIVKQAVLHKRPIRDNVMTGLLFNNFTLRKAADGVIRAENTTRLARDHARRANSFDQMIGFALTDAKVVLDETQAQYGEYAKRAFIPLSGVESIIPAVTHYGQNAPPVFTAGTGARKPSVMRKARTRK
jgi:hypothetical protein